MVMQFTLAWKDPEYHNRWVTSLQKGYDQFLHDLDTQGSAYFIKLHKEDTSLLGVTGHLYWEAVKGFLKRIKYPGFLRLFYKIDNMKQMLCAEELVSHLKNFQSLENMDHTLYPKAVPYK
uniref:Uncharacterized protein n=1 Tax=Cacopsylla melanoneura TaxID=428564 RepID=A0A8D8Z8A0_9HEMI